MHTSFVGISFYIGSPVSDVLDIIFPLVLTITLDDFYLHTLHTHTKHFLSTYQKYHKIKLAISDPQIFTFEWLKYWYIIYNIQSLQHSSKTRKIREKFGKFEKSGKIWKTQGNFSEIISLRENSAKSFRLPFNVLIL